MEKKVIDTIEKKMEVKVEKMYEITQNGKVVVADVKVGENDYRKIELKEMKNQYGPYYKIISESKYTRKRVDAATEKPAKKPGAKLRTKTEMLCGARRNDILDYAANVIESVKNGTAKIKEIEGAAKEDTVIRFVLLLNEDASRFKEDIEISEIKESLTA